MKDLESPENQMAEREPGKIDQFMIQQVFDHFLFEPLMEGQKDADQDDLDQKNFPWFSGCNIIDLVISDQDNEFEQKYKREESKSLDDPFRNRETAQHYKD